jgi:beta-glucuronidase
MACGHSRAAVRNGKAECTPNLRASYDAADTTPPDLRQALRHPNPTLELFDRGSEMVVDYSRYGRFEEAGTPRYRYVITDQAGLSEAVGEGIYPNEESLQHDPSYGKALRDGKLEGNVWDFIYHQDIQLAFFKWAGAEEEPGVRQFFTALQFERAGLLESAVKAYYAILVHFPDAVGWTEFQTPWYVGKVARDRIEAILRLHPELGLRLEGARVEVKNGFDNDTSNDVVSAWPGRLSRVEPAAVNPPSVDVAALPVKRELGKGRVKLRQYANGHWQVLVDARPWIIRGMSYQPSQVGESPDEGTLKDWMTADRNQNGKIDGPYDTFVDANRNNRQDPNEPAVGDIHLMRRMGVNTLRLYHHASNKALLRELYATHGIMILMGDLVGMYTVGSGAKWEEGTDYLDPVQRKRMTQSVQKMVKEFKGEPYVLMWVLGNENNYGGVHGIIGGRGNAAQHPKEFYEFLNELAERIHREDPQRPVAIANGEWLYLDLIARHAPAIDVFGANVYRGWHGFGRSFFEAVQEQLDKPVFITEFGSPAYQSVRPLEEGDLGQGMYHLGNWVDLEDNMAGRGVGNAVGGVVFAWGDEWWKAGQPPRFSPTVHDTVPNWSGPFPGGKNYEEWFGITSQGDGTQSPYLRQLRSAYFLYEQMWNSPSLGE